MSLKTLIEFGEAFDFTGAQFAEWCTGARRLGDAPGQVQGDAMPESVRLFERLMFLSVAIAVAAAVAIYLQFAGQMSSGDKMEFVLIAACLLILTAALTMLAARGRSKIARGILLGLLVLSVLQLVREAGTLLSDSVATALVQIAQLALQGYAISRLFTDEAKAYFDNPPPA